MLKSLLFYAAFFLCALRAHAQTTGTPFLKITHLGTEGRPIADLYLTTQEPAPDAAQGIDGRYIFQNVCLLTPAEFAPLLRYAEGYTASHKADSKDDKYGTFAITLGAGQPTQHVYTRRQSVAFLQGAVQVLQKQSAGPDQSEALRRLTATTRRLAASAK